MVTMDPTRTINPKPNADAEIASVYRCLLGTSNLPWKRVYSGRNGTSHWVAVFTAALDRTLAQVLVGYEPTPK